MSVEHKNYIASRGMLFLGEGRQGRGGGAGVITCRGRK